MENFGVHLGGAVDSSREARDVIHNHLDMAVAKPITFDGGYSRLTVQMQHSIGICTAEAVCSLIERFRNDGIVLSRRFTYLVGKTLVDGNLDEGSAIKSMLHGAYKYGTQPESAVPTDTTMSYADFVKFDVTPFLATATKIPGYINIPTDIDSLTTAMVKYNGVAARFVCGPTWWQDSNGINTWDAERLLPLKQPYTNLSGHAIVLSGYDLTTKPQIFILNSWSDKWCLGGFGYSIHSDYAPTEAWAITDMPQVIIQNPQFTQQMGIGTVGGQVWQLQKFLVKLGYGSFMATGFFGQKTFDAVKMFQKVNNIPQTGFFGPISIQTANRFLDKEVN